MTIDKALDDPRPFLIGAAKGIIKLVDLGVKCAPCWLDEDNFVSNPTAFSVFARSSIGKHCLRLANNVGIIDSDYVQPVYMMIYNISGYQQFVKNGERICQAELVREQPSVLICSSVSFFDSKSIDLNQNLIHKVDDYSFYIHHATGSLLCNVRRR